MWTLQNIKALSSSWGWTRWWEQAGRRGRGGCSCLRLLPPTEARIRKIFGKDSAAISHKTRHTKSSNPLRRSNSFILSVFGGTCQPRRRESKIIVTALKRRLYSCPLSWPQRFQYGKLCNLKEYMEEWMKMPNWLLSLIVKSKPFTVFKTTREGKASPEWWRSLTRLTCLPWRSVPSESPIQSLCQRTWCQRTHYILRSDNRSIDDILLKRSIFELQNRGTINRSALYYKVHDLVLEQQHRLSVSYFYKTTRFLTSPRRWGWGRKTCSDHRRQNRDGIWRRWGRRATRQR